MKSLPDLLSVLGTVAVTGDMEEVHVTDVVLRSDAVTEGALFCCVPGATVDGHDFAADAVSRGAVALLVERVVEGVDVPQLQVASVRAALGPLADLFFAAPSSQLAVFGVTGTNGKTTTTHLIDAMLTAAGRTPGLIGTIGARVGTESVTNGFTTPEAVDLQRLFAQMRDAGNDSVAIEVSSHALDQGRTASTRFAAVGFTNLTRDHLDYHRGFEAYYLAKRRLFVDRGPEGQIWPAAVNTDDEWGNRLFDELVHSDRQDVPVWGFTLEGMKRATVSATYELTSTGATIELESPAGDFVLKSRLRGRFNVENVLCATTMALLGGLTPVQIQAGLDAIGGVPGRFEPIDCGQSFDVFVDYAHTPDSLEQVLASAREIVDGRGGGRVLVVFGCGGDRDRSKRPPMGRAAALGADVAIVTSDNPRSEEPEAIIADIQKGLRRAPGEVVVEPDRRLAIQRAMEQAAAGDVVVIAGKGHEQGQTFRDRVVAFDDATVAREALAALAVR